MVCLCLPDLLKSERGCPLLLVYEGHTEMQGLGEDGVSTTTLVGARRRFVCELGVKKDTGLMKNELKV